MKVPPLSRAQRAENLERWAEDVAPEELVLLDTSELRRVAEVVEQRDAVDAELIEAVVAARRAGRSWSEIGTMLGVSKQAAQRRYASKARAA
jgi:predicted O-methyltransferase YrrM